MTNSWSYKNKQNKWEGVVKLIMSGEADFSIVLNAIRSERYDIVDFAAMSTWRHQYEIFFQHLLFNNIIKTIVYITI